MIQEDLNTTEQAIIKTLLYFDIFRHPLTGSELSNSLQSENPGPEILRTCLTKLTNSGLLRTSGDYLLLNGNEQYIRFRKEGNRRAERFMRRSRLFRELIATAPFVRGIFMTGSISKGVVPEKGDVDYFIITRSGRLWICRTLLILFKKIFLFNSRKYFCLNYFVDEDHLEVAEKNLFTATEVAFAIPLFNTELTRRFFTVNQWYRTYYPNMPGVNQRLVSKRQWHPLKVLAEALLSGKFGGKIEKWCYRKTCGHWAQKYKNMEPLMFDLNFRSYSHISKHHPHGFQFRVLQAYQQKIEEFEDRYKLHLS